MMLKDKLFSHFDCFISYYPSQQQLLKSHGLEHSSTIGVLVFWKSFDLIGYTRQKFTSSRWSNFAGVLLRITKRLVPDFV